MSHRPKIPEGVEEFSSLQKRKELGQKEWRPASHYGEKGRTISYFPPYSYDVTRTEFNSDKEDNINGLHDESFIVDVIPRLLEKKRKGEAFKVLDIGAGAGLYADQLRKQFENNPQGVKFEVWSTGLSKSSAREYRKRNDLPGLHPNELKWRSILELSDFPEFDLIIDSYGEQLYSRIYGSYRDIPEEKYFEIIFSKLKGYASIAPLPYLENNIPDWLTEMAKRFNVSISIKGVALKIQKNDTI